MDNYVRDMCQIKKYNSRKEYDNQIKILRKKYKMIPKKIDLIKAYNKLIENNEIEEHPTFYLYSLKKIGKSSSGVSVITVLTSPKPEYTINGEKIKQSFSCAKDCAYCPDEPEIRIILEVIEIDNYTITVSVIDGDIKIIRILSYIIYDNKEYHNIKSFNFKENTFQIEIKDIKFKIGDKIIGVKEEQPRSYLSSEPAVLRAVSNDFDCYRQFNDRAMSLTVQGHPIDKIEIIILGGTWDHYPYQYREEFIRDTYYSANVFSEASKRERLSLEEEIKINETAINRIIGLTIETRPDCITKRQIKNYRRMNITRVQLGIQHIDDDILEEINRDCSYNEIIDSINLLKLNGYKVDGHLMPDLPGSSFELDMEMFKKIFSVLDVIEINRNHKKYILEYPEIQLDQLKIYPCTTVDFTKIKEWYDEGIYKPYSEDEEKLIEVIKYIKTNIFPWIRLNRIIRDIPNINILGGNKNVNLRQVVINRMKNEGLVCNCIRCREIKGKESNLEDGEIFIDEYNDINATEYFINYSSSCRKELYGFIRLRINHSDKDLIINKEFINYGFVRELHVYGHLIKHNKKSTDNSIQHKGVGKLLLEKAEEICIINNIFDIAIISGVGVRGYYEKRGYHLYKNYMIKNLKEDKGIIEIILISLIIICVLWLFY